LNTSATGRQSAPERHFHADHAEVSGSRFQETLQPLLQPVVVILGPCKSDNLAVVQLVQQGALIERQFLELLDRH